MAAAVVVFAVVVVGVGMVVGSWSGHGDDYGGRCDGDSGGGGGSGSGGGWVVVVVAGWGWWRGLGAECAEAMVLHMARRHTRVRFTWETTPVGWLQTWSSTE